MEQTSPVNLYSGTDLKAVSDDHLPNALAALGYVQDDVPDYIRLAMGYIAVALAAITAYCDFKVGFEQTFGVIAACTGLYFVFNHLYLGTVPLPGLKPVATYHGTKGSTAIQIKTSTPKHSDIYEMEISEGAEVTKVTGQFKQWFDVRGFIVFGAFKDHIAGSVKKVE